MIGEVLFDKSLTELPSITEIGFRYGIKVRLGVSAQTGHIFAHLLIPTFFIYSQLDIAFN